MSIQEETLSTHPLAESVRKKLLADEIRLPSLPESVMKVKKILADEEKGAADIAKVIKDDQTLTTAIIRIANSSRFNTTGKETTNLAMAIQRLGGKQTFQILIAVSSKLMLQVKDKTLQALIRKSFQHAQMVAVAAQEIARLYSDPASEDAFLAGLVHDIGKPALVCAVPDELLKLPEAEMQSVLDTLHREVGGRLLSSWGLPAHLAQVASQYGIESGDRPSGKLIDYIDSANCLVRNQESGTDTDPSLCPAMSRLGLTEAQVISVEMEIEDAAEELQAAMAI
jgi:HD-like signal output (HDOD) protein